MKKSNIIHIVLLGIGLMLLASCSMTKNLPENEQLFAGLKKIVYADETEYGVEEYDKHLENTKLEVEAALATQPNGSLFGSSYISLPWSWHLWVYNKYSGKSSGFARWMTKTFGNPPVLMSNVNPTLRSSVARSVLRNNGYFRGDVTYDIIQQSNPKKCKIAYTVHLDSLYTLDSVSYVNFPAPIQALIDSTADESLIKSQSPFSINNLDAERSRISTLLRNNGYYYYSPSYASYLADTFAVDNKAQLRLQMADGIPNDALHKWYIGKLDVNFRKSAREVLNDSVKRRMLTIHFNGKKSPIRPGVILRNLRLRPRQEYNYDKYMESASKINATGVFSSTDFQFTPRPKTDTLDLRLNCTFDKPYDFYVEGNVIGRTNGRYGPELKIGLTRRNAFRAGEKLDLNLHGAYEWQRNASSDMSSYQYGADVSIEFPRIIAPFYDSDRVRRDKNGRVIRRKRFYSTPTTYLKLSTDIVRRPDYYKMHVVTGEWTYRWQSSETSKHEFSPLTLKYQYKNSTTEKYDSLVTQFPYLERTMGDYLIPKMRYTYTYTSPASMRHPIRWETTIEESGNLVSLYDVIRGKSFNEKNKELFKNNYSQFLRLETDFTKNWSVGMQSQLVAHVNAGIAWSYGNSDEVPYSEMFYAGGANTLRAFSARGIGPGRFNDYNLKDREFNYVFRNGEMKLIMNLEYRTPLFGNLHGAVFLDAGNVWNIRNPLGVSLDEIDAIQDEDIKYFLSMFNIWADQTLFKPSEFFNDISLGTGIGLRYDLGFLVIRVDWGIALHMPYSPLMSDDTFKGGYFNIGRFKDAQTLNFAIGYPF